ncbi:MAG: CheR family methyltransferase [Verrucomicrobiota bacterium]
MEISAANPRNSQPQDSQPCFSTQSHSPEKEFQQVSDLVYAHCKINLHEGKRELIQAHLSKKLRAGSFKSVTDYLEFVTSDPTGAAMTEMIDSLSTNLTSFFRENGHFEYLASKHIPALLTRKPSATPTESAPRAPDAPPAKSPTPWRSSSPKHWPTRVPGTPRSSPPTSPPRCSPPPAPASTTNPASRPSPRTFVTSTSTTLIDTRPLYEVVPALRQMVAIRHLNLMEEWPFSGPFDFIFCRNVMIYFDKPTQHKLVNRYFDILDSGGLLFTGHSESLTGIAHPVRLRAADRLPQTLRNPRRECHRQHLRRQNQFRTFGHTGHVLPGVVHRRRRV